MYFVLAGLFCVSAFTLVVEAKYNFNFSKAAKDLPQLPAQLRYLPLDHFGTNKNTFPNRYWVNDEFYQEGGPVFGRPTARHWIAVHYR